MPSAGLSLNIAAQKQVITAMAGVVCKLLSLTFGSRVRYFLLHSCNAFVAGNSKDATDI